MACGQRSDDGSQTINGAAATCRNSRELMNLKPPSRREPLTRRNFVLSLQCSYPLHPAHGFPRQSQVTRKLYFSWISSGAWQIDQSCHAHLPRRSSENHLNRSISAKSSFISLANMTQPFSRAFFARLRSECAVITTR